MHTFGQNPYQTEQARKLQDEYVRRHQYNGTTWNRPRSAATSPPPPPEPEPPEWPFEDWGTLNNEREEGDLC